MTALLLIALAAAPPAATTAHPSDEVCNVMTAHDPHPCTPEQAALLKTPHEHDASGNIVLMTRGTHGEIIRTPIKKADWIKKKQQEAKR